MKIIHLAKVLLGKSAWFVGAFQAALILVSFMLAWLLRFDFTLPNRKLLLASVCLLIVIRMAAIVSFGLLHGWWQYTSPGDALAVAKAVFSSSIVFFLSMQYALRLTTVPKAVYVSEALLTVSILIGVRILSRVMAESVRQDLTTSKKVLLIGAGVGAQTVVREIRRPGSEYGPIGYVDDDRSKVGLKIEGIPVLGTVDQIPELMSTYPVDEILIAVPSATSSQMQRFVEVCERSRVKFRTVPALRDVIAQRVSLSDFREVDVEDLLGREPIEINQQLVRSAIQGRTVLVTGAAGSIGSELCRQVLEHEPRILICIDQNETGMFYLERELLHCLGNATLICRVADTGDRRRIEHIFHETPPEIVFHAAAYKHVPLMEENVPAAVQNNVFGLMSLLELAGEAGCKSFILVSSDKAVNPQNVMGATKRIGELIIAHRPTNGMRCLSVRFGNVLGSNGSVIPVLQEQLRRNEPLTITDPRVKRFFMTLHEAVSLVLQASVVGEKGDTLVLDMGLPIPILSLAQTLIKLSGGSEKSVSIRFTGLRPGEKLSEELFYRNEEIVATSFPKIKRARGPKQNWSTLARKLGDLETTLFLNGSATIRAKIGEILPEYSYMSETATKTGDKEDLWPQAGQRRTA